METTTTTPKLFLTDYASYNEGTQFKYGHWVDLSDFSDADEFQDYINEHFEKVGISDPEPMFTDFEGFPSYLYSESFSNSELEKLFKYISIGWEDKSDDEKIGLWNEYASENNPDDMILEFDDDFFQTYYYNKPEEAARAVFFGKIHNWGDEYITFNGYGNLESMSIYEAVNSIDEQVLIDWLMENQ